jgi:hypothetical protein
MQICRCADVQMKSSGGECADEWRKERADEGK